MKAQINNSFFNKKSITSIYYKNTDNLQVRLNSWKKFGQTKITLDDWVINHLLPDFKLDSQYLDIGCGTGNLISKIKKILKNKNIYGIDISPAMVLETQKKILKKNHKNIIVGDIENLDFPNNTFDIITANFIFHHVPHINKAIKETKRVLKTNGVILITSYEPSINTGLNKIHYESLKELDFPQKMLNTAVYTRFSSKKALCIFKKYFSKIEILNFKNDLIFPSIKSAMDYYQSGMMFRNSNGILDPDISSDMWSQLISIMTEKIKKIINQKGKFVSPSNIIGFKLRK